MVPFARVVQEYDPPLPEGFEPKARPLGLSFTGTACSEPRLLELAYAFEQATHRRAVPPGGRGAGIPQDAESSSPRIRRE